MRLIKMLGLAAIAALAATAFLGTTSASAELNTQLCNVEPVELECPEGQETKLVHWVNSKLPEGPNGGLPTLLNSTADVLCLTVLIRAVVGELTGGKHKDPVTGEELLSANGALGNAPGGQEVHFTKLVYEGCGTEAPHTNCTVTVEELPLWDLLKIGEELASLKSTNGLTRVKCTIFGFVKIDCTYEGKGLLLLVSGPNDPERKTEKGDMHAQKTPAKPLKGANCPKESFLDALLLPLSPLYIAS
jgi:hypothetical protein